MLIDPSTCPNTYDVGLPNASLITYLYAIKIFTAEGPAPCHETNIYNHTKTS